MAERVHQLALAAGDAVQSRLVLRGEDRTLHGIVIRPGRWHCIMACPATTCAVATSGAWATDARQSQWQSFPCESQTPGLTCSVVFYTVSAEVLSPTDSLAFLSAEGEVATPALQSLLRVFDQDAGGDSHAVPVMHCQAEVGEATLFREIRTAPQSTPLAYNSVLMIPDFLTKEECYILMDAADRSAHNGTSAGKFYSHENGLNRFPLSKLDLEAQMLSKSVVSDRLLPFFEQHLPDVAEELFERRSGLRQMQRVYSPGEPAVNRYRVGGGIAPHTDKQAVTLNVVLSDQGAFTGGGTAFWPQTSRRACADNPDQIGQEEVQAVLPQDEEEKDDALVLRPLQGAALLFNGNVKHAGRAVTSGLRHVFVVSFSLWSLE